MFYKKIRVVFQAREIYEKAVEFFGEDYLDEKLFIAFAHFEESQKVPFAQVVSALLLFFPFVVLIDY